MADIYTTYLARQTDKLTRGFIAECRKNGDTDKQIAESIIRVNHKMGVQ